MYTPNAHSLVAQGDTVSICGIVLPSGAINTPHMGMQTGLGHWRGMLALASLLACGACLGGATGQDGGPDECRYEIDPMPPEQLHALVDPIEGDYAATVFWIDPALGLTTRPIDVEDGEAEAVPFSVGVRYAGTDSPFRYSCMMDEILPLAFVLDFRSDDERLDGEYLAAGTLRPDGETICMSGPSPMPVSAASVEPTASNEIVLFLANEADLDLPPWQEFRPSELCVTPDGEVWGFVLPTDETLGVW